MSEVPRRRSWRDWCPRRLSIRLLMVLVLMLGCGLGWLGCLKQAETAYQKARTARQVAEMAVVEYIEGIYKQERERVLGEVALADAERKRAEDRMVWSNRMYAKAAISEAQHTADQVSLQQKIFAIEQAETKKAVLEKYTRDRTTQELQSEVEKARSDEVTKKAVFDRLKSPGFMLSW